jgi:hypothetical protein
MSDEDNVNVCARNNSPRAEQFMLDSDNVRYCSTVIQDRNNNARQ